MEAKAWQEEVIIPTYEIGKPEKNPMFLEKRVYQGSSGVVYPYPVIEKIYDEKTDKKWQAVFLENDYLKIMILPQLGGRVQMAYDKMKQRHFVYYNKVIKPALVGLTGPWISGGIEFNWPQHHRPTTYDATDFCIEKNNDGSVTVWCSEIERMFRTKGMAGFTLYPNKAYLEIKVKLYNRTNVPQTFLWWANPAVKVNDHYQSVFPPDVNAVFDHGKRDVSSFPIATGTYYKVDYSPGTDISRYKNIPVPTSYMAIKSNYDFVGGYENDSKGGLLHVANHHVSPGKKQWTWGNGDFGQAWDRNLTDDDGPYIELMCGVYTDNQPDFSWLMPGEEKTFSQYFMPYRDLGVVKNASKEAMVNLEFNNNVVVIKAYTTAEYNRAKVLLTANNSIVHAESFDFNPGNSYFKEVQLNSDIKAETLKISIHDNKGNQLVEWQPEKSESNTIPEAAKAVLLPHEIESNEQLFLTGVHLEQYRHATYDPRPYYEEAIKRDPNDYRCNQALGLWYLKRGQFLKAEIFFRSSIETITQRNPNPIDGAPFYYMGINLRYQGRIEEAYDHFYKAVWNAAWMDNGYFQIACIDTLKGNYEQALENINCSLVRNWHHHKARHLKVAINRLLGKKSDALELCADSLKIDPFNFGVLYEQYLLGINESLESLFNSARGNIHSYIEFALDYAHAGLYNEAIQLIEFGIQQQKTEVFPMAFYYKAWFENGDGKTDDALKTLQLAAKQNPDYCFPNQTEAVGTLQRASTVNNEDYKACYYLGNYWYAHKNYDEAISCWEKSVQINQNFPTPLRNLALAYFNKEGNAAKALTYIQKAFEADKSDARVFMEMDQLYKRLDYSVSERYQRFEENEHLIDQRDDLYLEKVALLNQLGDHAKAYNLLLNRKFHPWEGGEGKVTGQYVKSLTAMAKEALQNGEFDKAVLYLKKAQIYPPNLGEGKLCGAQENEIFYYLGLAYQGLGNNSEATSYWRKAAVGLSEVSAAIFYNDQNPDTIYFQGLALLRLGEIKEAEKRFVMLKKYGEEHIEDSIKIDYFAVSLPDLLIWEDDLDKRNKNFCSHLIELANNGLNEIANFQLIDE